MSPNVLVPTLVVLENGHVLNLCEVRYTTEENGQYVAVLTDGERFVLTEEDFYLLQGAGLRAWLAFTSRI